MGRKIPIIILSFNDAEYVGPCIKSIKEKTKTGYEVILINNGCDKKNTKILELIKEVDLYIKKEENLGFPMGCNLGIQIALEKRTEHLCLLNSDTKIMTENWLENMMCVFKEKPNVGMVGAMSNYIANKWQDLKQFGGILPKKVIKADWLGLGITLISTSAMKKVGLIDEAFGYGGCEDLDYSIRLRKAGYNLYADGFTFIWHKGSVANKRLPIDYWKLQTKNKKILNVKHGEWLNDKRNSFQSF